MPNNLNTPAHLAMIDRLWRRDDTVLADLADAFGRLCQRIAMNILKNREDSEEVVNDTWLRVWDSIPVNRPDSMTAYTGRITRNLALSRYRRDHAACRDRNREMPWEELTGVPENEAFCLAGNPTAEAAETAELARAMADWLNGLPQGDRVLFVRRYWRLDEIDALAQEMHMTPANVRVKLHRLRGRLKKYLEGEGLL
ncbi:MAG: sigma-70 family RNA polymerase sigma factor [Clostridia bacterium]|nr:sigma-70 family RNA polymerase sigma factor [Clostridia bacterium]